jgi:hypothetical protein
LRGVALRFWVDGYRCRQFGGQGNKDMGNFRSRALGGYG